MERMKCKAMWCTRRTKNQRISVLVPFYRIILIVKSTFPVLLRPSRAPQAVYTALLFCRLKSLKIKYNTYCIWYPSEAMKLFFCVRPDKQEVQRCPLEVQQLERAAWKTCLRLTTLIKLHTSTKTNKSFQRRFARWKISKFVNRSFFRSAEITTVPPSWKWPNGAVNGVKIGIYRLPALINSKNCVSQLGIWVE